jgi:transglutaminase-like putative cysteine protease
MTDAVRDEISICLESTPIVDSDSELVRSYATARSAGATDPVERAVRLFYAVRDDIRYDPYTSVDLSVEGLKASRTLASGRGWCVSKAVLLAACCRAMGLPARIGFADVKNHLTTARMRAAMKTDVFYWHGYTSILLNGMWVKATPAFNIELCRKFRLHPLEFDGRTDSIYHPFDLDGNRHMEYVRHRGEFADVPVDAIRETFLEVYAHGDWGDLEKGDFDAEVDLETSGS